VKAKRIFSQDIRVFRNTKYMLPEYEAGVTCWY